MDTQTHRDFLQASFLPQIHGRTLRHTRHEASASVGAHLQEIELKVCECVCVWGGGGGGGGGLFRESTVV